MSQLRDITTSVAAALSGVGIVTAAVAIAAWTDTNDTPRLDTASSSANNTAWALAPGEFHPRENLADYTPHFYVNLGHADFGDDDLAVSEQLERSRVESQANIDNIVDDVLDVQRRDDGSVMAILSADQRVLAQTRGRLDISRNPYGWPADNPKVTLTFPSGVVYNGYFWNRSHLIADSLGGNPSSDNLIPGTRAQNVGDNTTPGGMGYVERIARDFLDNQIDHTPMIEGPEVTQRLAAAGITTDADGEPIPPVVKYPAFETCQLAYKVTPNVVPGEVIPRTVTVDMRSCDKTIDQRTVVYNTAPQGAINYATGEVADI